MSAPVGVQGFIVAHPLDWTRGENNNSGMNLRLLAQIEATGNKQTIAQVPAATKPEHEA